MININSVEELKKIKTTDDGHLGLVVHFSASWCEPCSAINTFLESKLSALKGKVLVAQVDCEKHSDICEMEDVDRVPYVLFYRRSNESSLINEPVADVSGAKMDLIEQNLTSLYCPQQNEYSSLNDYLKFLTTRKGIVMFITGSPSRPRCGFTGQLCNLMDELKASYIYYDVMASNEVCEGLKVFAEWPTYPQVYVDGELIGGFDICKELHESGELKKALKLE